MRRWLTFLLVASVFFAVGLAATDESVATAQDGDGATIEAQETEISELETKVAKLEARGDQFRTRVSELQVTEPGSTAVPEEAERGGSGSSLLGGNAVELLPPGDKGEVSVVLTGIYDGNTLPIVIRNTTDEAVQGIAVSVTVRDETDALISVGGDQGFGPNLVEAGSYTLGYAYFDGVALPSDAAFEFDVTSSPAQTPDSFSQIDLDVTESSFLGDRIVGTLVNNFDGTVTGPMEVVAVCIGSQGELLDYASSYTDKDEATAGEIVPFQIDLYGGVDCTNHLIAAGGYNF